MKKQKPSSDKEIVKADAPSENSASQSTGADENTMPESDKPDIKAEKQEQVKARTEEKSKVKPEEKSEVKQEVKPAAVKPDPDTKPKKAPKASRGFPLFGLLNLLLIIGIVAAAGYYWQMQQKTEQQNNKTIAALQAQLASKMDASQLQQQLAPLESGIGNSVSQISELQLQQAALQESAEKLFELYGRDESDWQLAEVEYLMRIAQHKLILENDFEGAAITLQAASDKIAATADPGLLPVRVQISDEIAVLKTRSRPDLVGMTLVLSQLSRQIKALTPGYLPRIDSSQNATESEDAGPVDQTITERVVSFITSQVSLKKEDSPPTQTEALVVDIEQTMEDNLKLTRWTVLERDNFQFRQLMEENLRLFKQFYNLDDAANYDFYTQLLELQKATVKPEKPDISGSLELLKRIISKRENAPQQVESEGAENG
jgi:uroporphyrin-3 C-methyltransferase